MSIPNAFNLIFQLVLIVIVRIVRPDVVVVFFIVISLQINITCNFAISLNAWCLRRCESQW